MAGTKPGKQSTSQSSYNEFIEIIGHQTKSLLLYTAMTGIALLMQAAISSAAHAEDKITEQFRLAAATIPSGAAIAPKKNISYPELFGTAEIRSSNITPFTKWTSVITRFEKEMRTQSSSSQVTAWKAALGTLQDKSVREQLTGVNDYVNSVKYVEDRDIYGKSDYWATPIQFFSRNKGDCEDFAIAKYASLRALGYSSDQLRIAIVQDTIKNIPHAVLIVYTDEGSFILDNQNKRVENAANVTRYQPIFSINSTSWWLHRKTIS